MPVASPRAVGQNETPKPFMRAAALRYCPLSLYLIYGPGAKPDIQSPNNQLVLLQLHQVMASTQLPPAMTSI